MRLFPPTRPRGFVSPPVVDSLEQAQQVIFLKTLLWSGVILTIVFSPIFLIIIPHPVPNLIIDICLIGIAWLITLLIRRRQIRLAGYTLSFSLWVFLTVVIFLLGGVHNPTMGSYIHLILIAGLLLGWRATMLFIILSCLSSAAILYAQLIDRLPPSLVPLTPLYVWLVSLMNLASITILLYLAISNFNQILARSRRQQADLADRNRELQESRRLLRERAQQQAAIAELGQIALAGEALDTLLHRAAGLVAQTLDASFSSLLEYLSATDQFRLRAAAGYSPDEIGDEWVVQAAGTQAGYTLQQGLAVVYEDLAADARFQQVAFPRDQPIRSGMSVIIPGSDRPFGVLSAHTMTLRHFSQDDTNFLQAIAHTLAEVIARREAEAILKRNEAYFRSLIENSLDIITVLEMDGTVRYGSPSVKRVLGYSPELLVGRSVEDFLHPDDVPEAQAIVRQLKEQLAPTQRIELRVRHANGVWRTLEAIANPLADETGRVELVVNARDITNRKQVAAILAQRAYELETLYEMSLQINVQTDITRLLNMIVQQAASLLETTMGEISLVTPDRQYLELVAVYNQDQPLGQRVRFGERLAGRVAARGEFLIISNYDAWEGRRPDLSIGCYGRMIGVPLRQGDEVIGVLTVFNEAPGTFDEDEIRLLSLFAAQAAIAIQNTNLYEQLHRELEERKRAQGLIQASLLEKEVLLKEIHHRVKNNLQIICSLLDLQSDTITDEGVRQQFRASQNRVKSMSLIHEQLYQTENLARIDFATYVRRLAGNLMRSYRLAANIDLETTVAGEVLLSLNEAIPCGLIVNELVSNALKHGFTQGQAGKVHIELEVDGSQIRLAVADNGLGLPPEFDLYQVNSLGLQLVTLLTRQLQGTISLDRNGQTRFVVSFISQP